MNWKIRTLKRINSPGIYAYERISLKNTPGKSSGVTKLLLSKPLPFFLSFPSSKGMSTDISKGNKGGINVASYMETSWKWQND